IRWPLRSSRARPCTPRAATPKERTRPREVGRGYSCRPRKRPTSSRSEVDDGDRSVVASRRTPRPTMGSCCADGSTSILSRRERRLAEEHGRATHIRGAGTRELLQNRREPTFRETFTGAERRVDGTPPTWDPTTQALLPVNDTTVPDPTVAQDLGGMLSMI